MKHAILLTTFFMLAVGSQAQIGNGVTPLPEAPPPTSPQVSAPAAITAAATADKQAADERYERLASDVQALQTQNESLQNKIGALEDEIRKLRDEMGHQGDHAVTADDVKQLAQKIEEVDRKREDDKTAITEQVRNSIAGLEKALGSGGGSVAPPPSRVSTPRQPVNDNPPPNVANGFVYTVHDGDSLSAIVHAYNVDFKSKGMKPITLKQAREANPNVNFDKLRVGQKIIIPRPE